MDSLATKGLAAYLIATLVVLPLARRVTSLVVEKPMSSPQGVPLDALGEKRRLYAIVGFRRLGRTKSFLALGSWCAVLEAQAAVRLDSGREKFGSARTRRQCSSSPLRRAASRAASAKTPSGDQLIP